MLAVEKYKAIYHGELLDEMPVAVFDNLVAAQLMGQAYQTSESSVQSIADKLIKSAEMIGHDDVSIIIGSKSLGIPWGSKQEFKLDNTTASLVGHAIDDVSEYKTLDPTLVTVEADAHLGKLYEAAVLIDQHFAGKKAIRIAMSAPFSGAGGVIEAERLLKSTRSQADDLHGLLKLVTEVSKGMIDSFAQIPSVIFHLSDPYGSGSLISPKIYESFCLPYTQELVNHIHSYERAVTLHICGDTSRQWELIAETGADIFSVDQAMDLGQVKETVGDKMVILGNLDPINLLAKGTPEEVDSAVKAAQELAGDSPRGLIVGPGCDVLYDTPVENLQAMVEAARES